MRISRKADYALRAMSYMANQPDGKRSSISEIAENEAIPRDFLAKILKELTGKGLLKSYQGVTGGYQLAKRKSEITFLQIIEAMNDKIKVSLYVDKKGAPLQLFWSELQDTLIKTIQGVTLDNSRYVLRK